VTDLGLPLRKIWWQFDRMVGARARQNAAARRLLARAQDLHQQNKLAEAEEAYGHVLALAPRHVEAWHLAGVVQMQRENDAGAVELISRALHIEPALGTAWYDLGNALMRLNRHEEAVACYDRAVQLNPAQPKIWKDRGAALRRLDRLADSLDSYDRALALRPDYVEALIGRGTALHDLKRVPEALTSYGRALALRPGDGPIHHNRALCKLLLGDLRGAWPEFEWRQSHLEAVRAKSRGLGARWDGSQPLAGKSILLWAEPGFGETIHFCRFARLVAARGAQVLLLVPDAREADVLAPLLQGLEGPSCLLRSDELAPETDYHCSLLSLPLALQIDLDSLSAERPYLHADPARVAAWGARLGPRRLPRIGLAWSGNPARSNDRKRSIPLQQFLPMVQGPFEFVSIQKDLRETDMPVLAQRPDIRRFEDALQDFGDTAALLQHMDVVVSVDTSVAHLAGALGRPVWILLSYVADWRYLLDRDDSPWYPTARLFRQPAIGDWSSVCAAVGRELAATTFPLAEVAV